MGLFNDGTFLVLCENCWIASFEFLVPLYPNSAPQEIDPGMERYLQQVWGCALIYEGVRSTGLGRGRMMICDAIAHGSSGPSRPHREWPSRFHAKKGAGQLCPHLSQSISDVGRPREEACPWAKSFAQKQFQRRSSVGKHKEWTLGSWRRVPESRRRDLSASPPQPLHLPRYLRIKIGRAQLVSLSTSASFQPFYFLRNKVSSRHSGRQTAS